LSGCDAAVPVETDGGPGTACLHWDEVCFRGELMTGYESGGLQMSRITLGTLEDLGYTVDYSKADPFPASEMDPSCVCNAAAKMERKEKEDQLRGKVLSPHEYHAMSAENAEMIRKRPPLSNAARQAATEYGRMKLKGQIAKAARGSKGQSDFVGEQYIVVYYMENDHIYSIVVRNDAP